jgi:secreted PhoX family phosphatase
MKKLGWVRNYSDGDVDTNHMGSRTLESMAAERYSRRQTLLGSLQATAMAFLGTGLLAACDDDDDTAGPSPVVSVGQNATTSAGRLVTLTGTVAGSSGGTSAWRQTGGPAVTLTASGNNASFIAPGVASSTPLTFAFEATGSNGSVGASSATVTVNPAMLGFEAVAKNRLDLVTVPAGYTTTVMTRLGDPIAAGVSAYANNGTDANFAQRIGDHGDALYYFGLSATGARDDNSSMRGLLVQNHENISEQYLHPAGPTLVNGVRPEGEAIKEIEAHGVSVTEYRDTGNRQWTWIQDSPFNRRITPNTPVTFHGPVRGSDMIKTAYSPDGTQGRGTINNCANGATGWGTMLTCEENWAGYFRRDNTGAETDNAQRTARELTSLRRYGVNSTSGNNRWSTVQATNTTLFRRWDARATAGSATEDFRNEPNQFGWVVELDPYNPASVPRKRTTLGRMGHEGAWLGRLTPGQKVAVYTGDDARREYLYKFVSSADWSAADAQATDRLAMGDKYLDSGTLYVARFNPDGTGTWLPLVFGQVPNRPAVGLEPEYTFADQADVLVNTRLAADAQGATPMDRPEWTATNPLNGEIYLTLTNNNAAGRPINGTDAANPRHYTDPKLRPGFQDLDPNAQYNQQYGNPNGHIIRLRENGDNNAATSFSWDIYLFGADSAQADPNNVNLSKLTGVNDFSSPDGLWFSRSQNPAGQGKPLLWIQTDDGAFTDVTNNQMLAALPGTVGDGGAVTITNVAQDGTTAQQSTIVGAPATAATVRRFLVGPNESEITGVDSTPDGRTLFVGIQHPGEAGEPNAPSSNWPQSQSGNTTGRPRSAVVAITKNDGGIVGL